MIHQKPLQLVFTAPLGLNSDDGLFARGWSIDSGSERPVKISPLPHHSQHPMFHYHAELEPGAQQPLTFQPYTKVVHEVAIGLDSFLWGETEFRRRISWDDYSFVITFKTDSPWLTKSELRA